MLSPLLRAASSSACHIGRSSRKLVRLRPIHTLRLSRVLSRRGGAEASLGRGREIAGRSGMSIGVRFTSSEDGYWFSVIRQSRKSLAERNWKMEILRPTALVSCKGRRKTSGGFLLGAACRDRKGVNRSGQFLGQRRINPPLAFDPAKSSESRRDDLNGEMRLAFRAGAGMTGMSSRIIDDVELYRF